MDRSAWSATSTTGSPASKHPFEKRADGTRAVTLILPAGQRFRFRYLAHGDYWFDEDCADGQDGHNSLLNT
ncbi:hypothetical protein [Kitasatospora sp. GP82]|uniref:hypothetical protein n=1 Tax=Kitasatospora sp. GP82 TaxID=3035089 RepID=UPI00247E697E|nr:hypothetical protein [Kitasatospora sp. GP82]